MTWHLVFLLFMFKTVSDLLLEAKNERFNHELTTYKSWVFLIFCMTQINEIVQLIDNNIEEWALDCRILKFILL